MSFVEEEFQELMTIESSNSLSGVNSNDIYIYIFTIKIVGVVDLLIIILIFVITIRLICPWFYHRHSRTLV